MHRPVIIDRTIYLSRGKFDLLTGEGTEFRFSRGHGCGLFVASSSTLLFRSAVLGYVDVNDSEHTRHFGGVRPGCWVNAIPAGGMVLMPDYSAKCNCSYLNRSTLALEPIETEKRVAIE